MDPGAFLIPGLGRLASIESCCNDEHGEHCGVSGETDDSPLICIM
jgi:hypothetical protein